MSRAAQEVAKQIEQMKAAKKPREAAPKKPRKESPVSDTPQGVTVGSDELSGPEPTTEKQPKTPKTPAPPKAKAKTPKEPKTKTPKAPKPPKAAKVAKPKDPTSGLSTAPKTAQLNVNTDEGRAVILKSLKLALKGEHLSEAEKPHAQRLVARLEVRVVS